MENTLDFGGLEENTFEFEPFSAANVGKSAITELAALIAARHNEQRVRDLEIAKHVAALGEEMHKRLLSLSK